MSKDKKKPLNKKTIVYDIFIGIFALIAIGCGIYLGIYYFTNEKGEKKFVELKDMIVSTDDSDKDSDKKEVEYVDVDGNLIIKDFEKIYSTNKDFYGWITIADTHIDYPVMYTPEDEEYYIHRDFDKKNASHGTLFIDGACSIGSKDESPSNNLIIYGHNMKLGTMFHDLTKYEDEEFYKAHKTFTFDTIYGKATYEVIAAFRSQVYEEDSKNFKYYEFVGSDNSYDFSNYVNNVKKLTPYDIDSTASYGDKLITLSTCAYHTEDGRYAVVAKKVK